MNLFLWTIQFTQKQIIVMSINIVIGPNILERSSVTPSRLNLLKKNRRENRRWWLYLSIHNVPFQCCWPKPFHCMSDWIIEVQQIRSTDFGNLLESSATQQDTTISPQPPQLKHFISFFTSIVHGQVRHQKQQKAPVLYQHVSNIYIFIYSFSEHQSWIHFLPITGWIVKDICMFLSAKMNWMVFQFSWFPLRLLEHFSKQQTWYIHLRNKTTCQSLSLKLSCLRIL